MKLLKIQVKNFRSVEDSGEFDIADPVTCLVGKNEAGKSALLLALAALNPNQATPVNLDVERDFPRSKLIDYTKNKENNNALVTTTSWELEQREIEAIAQTVGEGVIKSPTIKITMRYDEKMKVNAELDDAKAINYLFEKYEIDAEKFSDIQSVQTFDELIEKINQSNEPSDEYQELVNYLQAEESLCTQVSKIVTDSLPTFLYVSSYDRMDGAIQIEQTQGWIDDQSIKGEGRRGAQLFVEFLEYAGIPLNEIIQEKTYETFDAKLQAASNNITDELLEYWSQNPDLEVNVRIESARSGDAAPFNEGTIARARIKNNLHRVDTPFSERSAGFVWFFSFLIKFAQIKHDNVPVILLLDEPGLSLHGKAQGELLRFFVEKLAPHHQLIYSTHSPFMVPSDQFDIVRIVEDKVSSERHKRTSIGTKVTNDVLLVDADSMFPLQGALGIQALQTLFVGEHTLLVEGPSDILYLQVLSEALKSRGLVGLDDRWTLCPSGGIDNILPFITLFRGKGINIAVLSDRAADKKRTIDRIDKSKLMQASHFYTVADFLESDEADIEDILGPQLYAEIVNACYKLSEFNKITLGKLNSTPSEVRLVNKTKQLFREMPEANQNYNHYKPAVWLNKNSDLLQQETKDVVNALETAQSIFDTYNKLLPPQIHLETD